MEDKLVPVISGASARIPDCENITEFMEKVYSKVSMTGVNTTWPRGGHTDVPYYSGVCKDALSYDMYAFYMTRAQAICQIPQVPKLLEMAYEAIIDSGTHPKELSGTNCGVYTLANKGDIDWSLQRGNNKRSILGSTTAYASARIAYSLNVIGPNLGISGYQSVLFYLLKKAVEDIREGRLESCLVGAVDFVQEPNFSKEFDAFEMLAQDGECLPFDENAHGMVRSDGGVMFFLQEASKAKRWRALPLNFDCQFLCDHTLDSVHHDPDVIIKMLKKFYADCNIDPGTVKYVEADGAGVKALDEVELKVLTKVFAETTLDELLVGSVASNVGRSETSSGLISLLKAVMSFGKGTIPPTRNHRTPNSKSSALTSGKIKVVTEETGLKGDLIAVNSLSFVSAFGHALIKKPPPKTAEEVRVAHHLYLLSSRTEEGLEKILDRAENTPLSRDFTDLANGVFHKQMHGFYSRGVLVMSETEGCVVRKTGHADSSRKRPLWFVFSGMGSQKNGMGRALLQIPVFAEVIEKCDAVLSKKGIDIKYILTSPDETIFDSIINAFVGITAAQIGLIEVLRNIGLEADKFVGHSLGEQACGYADGAVTLEEAILSAWARGQASQEAYQEGLLIPGMMAAVGLGYQEIKDRLPEPIEAACHNSKNSVTISGPAEDVKEFVAKLKDEEVFAKEVNVGNIAYHSRYIKPIGEKLLAYLKEIIKTPKERSEKWISSSVPRANWDTDAAKYCSAEYFTNNLLSSVLFEEAFADVPADAVILEVSPQSLLLPILKNAFPASVTSLSLTGRVADEVPGHVYVLSSVGDLYLLGYEPNPSGLYPPITYPVDARTPDLSPFVLWEHSFKLDYEKFIVPRYDLLKVPPSRETERELTIMHLKEFRNNFEGHVLQSRPMIPLSYYLSEIWMLLAPKGRFAKEFDEVTPHFKDILVQSVIWMDQLTDEAILFIQLCPGSGKFEVCLLYRRELDRPLRGHVIVTGKVVVYEENLGKEMWRCMNDGDGLLKRKLNIDDLRHAYGFKGYDLSPEFQNNITQLEVYDQVSKGKLVWKKNWQSLIDGVIKASMLMNVDDFSVSCPATIQSLIIKPDEIKLLEHGDEINFTLDHQYNILVAAERIEMKGIIFKAPAMPGPVPQGVECREFLPYFSSNFQREEDFAAAILDILCDNSPTHNEGPCNVNICENGKIPKECGILSALRNTAQRCYSSEINLTINNKAATKLGFCGVNLMITSGSSLKADLSQQTDFILCFLERSKSLSVPGYREVIRYGDANRNTRFILLKKLCQSKQNIFKSVDKDWAETLANLETRPTNSVVTLVWEKQPELNPHEIIEDLKASGRVRDSIRCIFIADENAPSFSERNPFYSEQLRFGFGVNFLQNGMWCTLRKVKVQDANPEFLPDIVSLSKVKREDIDIHFMSLNTQTQRSKNSEQDIYVLEYSGVTKDRKKVMGLAQFKPETSNLEISIDPNLIWEIPPGASMEDAATLPLLCCMANYALIMCVTSYDVNSGIVLNGSSNHGLSFLAVAYHAQLDVYTTVYGAEEQQIVKKHFPQMEDSHIIDASKDQFNLRLKLLTGGRGVDLVVSDVGPDLVGDTWECVAPHGSLIDLNEGNMTRNTPLPMFHFLKNTAYYSCLKTTAFSLKEWRKQELWNLVQNTLSAKVMVRLPRSVYNANQLDVAARALNKETGRKKILLSMKNSPENLVKNIIPEKSINYFNVNDTYLILSPSIGNSLGLIEFILVRGGRKFVLVVSNQVGNSKKLNDLIDKYKAQLLISSVRRLTSGVETATLVEQVKTLGPVPTLFNVYMDEKLASYVKSLLPSPCRTVSVTSPRGLTSRGGGGGGNIKGGASHLSIVCDDGDSYLRLLDQALLNKTEPKTDATYSIRTKNTTSRKKQVIPLRDVLPNTFSELEEIGQRAAYFPKTANTNTIEDSTPSIDDSNDDSTDASKNSSNPVTDGKEAEVEAPPCAVFEETSTITARHKHQREILPMYLISSSVKKFSPVREKLLYPLYVAKFSEEVPSTAKAAEHLYKSLSSIQPNGPCSIITETWHLETAMEIIKLLKKDGRLASLTILPINQKSLQSLLTQQEDLEDVILRNILQLSKEEYHRIYSEMELKTKVAEIYKNESSKFERKVAEIYKNESSKFERELVLSGIRTMKRHLELFLKTPLPNKSIDCPVLVVEMEATVGNQMDYFKISKGEVKVETSPATSYTELLADPKLSNLLNSRQLYTWSAKKVFLLEDCLL